MSVRFFYKEMDDEELHGDQVYSLKNYFHSKKELKKEIKSSLNSFSCPSCGGHRISGNNGVVEIGKVRLYREKKKRGLFGTKYVEENYQTVYRVYGIYLKPGGFLDPAGWARCNSCGWEEKGGKKKSRVRWMSINEVINKIDSIGR